MKSILGRLETHKNWLNVAEFWSSHDQAAAREDEAGARMLGDHVARSSYSINRFRAERRRCRISYFVRRNMGVLEEKRHVMRARHHLPLSQTREDEVSEPLSDETAPDKAIQEWLECVTAIRKRSAEIGPEWSQERAGALLAVLAQAGYTFVKFDDLSDDGVTPKSCLATMDSLRRERDEARDTDWCKLWR